MTEQCANCRFWCLIPLEPTSEDPGADDGYCRRRAPKPADVDRAAAGILGHIAWALHKAHDIDTGPLEQISHAEEVSHYAEWPRTGGDNWCGEYEACQ